MVVHPGAGNKIDTLVNILLGSYKKNLSTLSGSSRPELFTELTRIQVDCW